MMGEKQSGASKRISIAFGYFIGLFSFWLLMCFHQSIAVAALEDHVYVKDQYGERWTPGQMTGRNIFATINDPHVADSKNAGEKLLAPGTSGKYSFTIYNEYTKAIRYKVIGRNENKDKIPLEFKIRVDGGPWIVGGNNDWELWNKTFPLDYTRALGQGKKETLELEWQWPFEADRDNEDTDFGGLAQKKDILYKLSLNIMVEEDEEQSGSSSTNNSYSADESNSTGNSHNSVGKESKTSTLSDAKDYANISGKPWRQLPQTGETAARSSLVIGILIIVFVYFVWKVKQGRK